MLSRCILIYFFSSIFKTLQNKRKDILLHEKKTEVNWIIYNFKIILILRRATKEKQNCGIFYFPPIWYYPTSLCLNGEHPYSIRLLCYFQHLTDVDVYLLKSQIHFCETNHNTSIILMKSDITFITFC
jgi:hypothetical protein